MENGTVESVVSKRHENRPEAPANILQYALAEPPCLIENKEQQRQVYQKQGKKGERTKVPAEKEKPALS